MKQSPTFNLRKRWDSVPAYYYLEQYEKFNHRRLTEESQAEDDEFENLAKRMEKKNKLAESCGEDVQ